MNTLEIRRQIFHALFGIAIIVLVMFGFIDEWGVLILILIGLIISHISKHSELPVVSFFLKKFERPADMENFPGKGMITYLIGCFLVLFFFPQDIALPSIAALAIGDPVSRLFGIHLGKRKSPLNDMKFIEGTIAGFFAAFVAIFYFIRWRWIEALLAAFFAMLAEAMDIKLGGTQVDDNIVVPVVAAVTLWVVGLLF